MSKIFTESTSISLVGESPKGVKVLRGLLMLNPGVTAINFYCSWLQLIIIATIWLSVDTLQALLIKDKFKIPQEESGMTVAKIQLVDYTVKICAALIYGPLIDFAGRKIMYYYGLCSVVLGYLLIPLQSNIYPGYLLCKLLISNGGIVIQMLPLLADYVHLQTKGIAAGLNYTLGFIGAAIAAGFLYLFGTLEFTIGENYVGFGIYLASFGALIGIGMIGGNQYYKKKDQDLYKTPNFSLKEQLMHVFHSFSTIPWLWISMICSILGNSDYYVLTTGLVFYIQSYMPPPSNINDNEESPATIAYYNSVNKKVGETQATFFVLCIIVTAIYGKIMDKIPHMKLLLPLMIVATLGFYLVPFIDSIYGALFYIFLVIEGSSLPGVFVFATFLGIVYSPSDQRGTIGGIITGVGLLTAMFVIVVGGVIHDKDNLPDASFLLFSGILTLSTLIVTAIYIFKIRNLRNREHHNGIDFSLQSFSELQRKNFPFWLKGNIKSFFFGL